MRHLRHLRHYEKHDGSNGKFWEIVLQDTTVSLRYGRLGSQGRKQRFSFESTLLARHDWERRIRGKVKDGYILTFSTPDMAQGQAAPLAVNRALEEAILANPDQDQPILVYGDWLSERGDPRGEAISTYREMHRATDTARYAELKKHAQEIIAGHPSAFFGSFLSHADNVRIRWRFGFFDDVRVSPQGGAMATHATIRTLVQAPAAFLMRRLTIEECDGEAAINGLLEGHLAALQTLELGFASSSNDDSVVHSEAMHRMLNADRVPHLSRLVLRCSFAPDPLMEALSESPLAKQVVHLGFESQGPSEQLAARLTTHFPKLRSFEFRYSAIPDDIIAELRAIVTARAKARDAQK